MGLYLKIDKSDYLLGVWKTDEGIDELLSLLPESNNYYRQGISVFKSPHRQLEWLSVRALLFTLLQKEVTISYLPSGKPVLNAGEGYISISHTKGFVAVIISKHHEVGIDIEQYSTRVARVSSRFMRDDEELEPYEGDEIWSMLLHWSAKETIFKSISTSEVDFKEHLQIYPFKIASSGSFTAAEYRTKAQLKFEIQYVIQPQFVLTWQIQ